MTMNHPTEDDLVLYHYGEIPGARSEKIDEHLRACGECSETYQQLAATLAAVTAPDPPARDERYGREVWQRIRHDLPPRDPSPWAAIAIWLRPVLAGALATLIVGAFFAGRYWPAWTAAPVQRTQPSDITELRSELREM